MDVNFICSKPGCKKVAWPGRSMCRHHLDLNQARQAKRRAALRSLGACVECRTILESEDLTKGHSRCPSCRAASHDRWMAWRKRNKWYRVPGWVWGWLASKHQKRGDVTA